MTHALTNPMTHHMIHILLHTADIPTTITTVPSTLREAPGGVKLLTHDLFTNDVLYLDFALDLRPVPAELLPLLPLFSRCMPGPMLGSALFRPGWCRGWAGLVREAGFFLGHLPTTRGESTRILHANLNARHAPLRTGASPRWGLRRRA